MRISGWSVLRSNWQVALGFAVLFGVAWQLHATQRASRLEASLEAEAPRGPIVVGIGLGTVAGTTLDRRYASVSLDNGVSAAVVIAMSVQCKFCETNLEAWRRISVQAQGRGLKVIWVARDPLNVVTRAGAPWPDIIVDPTYATFIQLKLWTVPQTLVVDKTGLVRYAHAGLLDASAEGFISSVIAGSE